VCGRTNENFDYCFLRLILFCECRLEVKIFNLKLMFGLVWFCELLRFNRETWIGNFCIIFLLNALLRQKKFCKKRKDAKNIMWIRKDAKKVVRIFASFFSLNAILMRIFSYWIHFWCKWFHCKHFWFLKLNLNEIDAEMFSHHFFHWMHFWGKKFCRKDAKTILWIRKDAKKVVHQSYIWICVKKIS